MALFQSSVLKDHLRLQDEQQVTEAYNIFTSFFHNSEIQENIRSSKEEQFQATFLNELFVKVLGYTMNPQPGYDLTTEFKNQKNARKADGALLKDGLAIGVIELKGTNTKHLEGIRQQAFDYKANQKGCVYVITSNFEKLRFYINDATEFVEFDLFELNRDDFSLLYLCLHKDSIISNRPLKIKEASIVEEEVITKQFYKDYSVFKRELFRDLVLRNVERIKKDRPPGYESDARNPEAETKKQIRLNLFKKSQKLIDRFLFIFFAEDRGLLPPNSIHKILSDWNKLKDLDAVMPLYDRFKLYFSYLDTGRKGTDKKAEIFAYNGGLFKPDPTLDMMEIDDELLYKHTSQLAKYDFESQVDVNILGHIFENSLNEIESVNAEIEGADFDKQKSKRKKDGVFYTPKYITKYIVENTVGRLCEEKKSELGFREEEYYKGRKQRQTKTVKALIKILDDYRDWLLKLTICDPACGSGAFLNQALDFLIKEHQYIDEMKSKLLGGSLVFSDIETTILENNIYGVDINEESVEIAKLSLWLRTAQPRRKLNDLSSNIKCGNSLIDDRKVAGDKAFKWVEEFPEIFANGGFDVVIGNPPYVRIQNIESKLIDYYFKKYLSPKGKLDLSILFFEKALKLINDCGQASFISSSQWMQTDYGENIRGILAKNKLTEIINFGSLPVFSDVETYPAIFFLSNKGANTFVYREIPNRKYLSYSGINNSPHRLFKFEKLSSKPWQFSAFNLLNFLNEKKSQYYLLQNIAPAYIGCLTGMDAAFVVDDKIILEKGLEKEIIFPYAYRGQEISRFTLTHPQAYIIYPYHNRNGDVELFSNQYFAQNYPNCYNHLLQFKNELVNRKDSRKKYAFEDNFYRHLRAGSFHYISPEKLILKGVDIRFTVGLLRSDTAFNGANTPALIPKPDSNFSNITLLSILNSKLISFYLNQICPKKLGGYFRYNAKNVSNIPIVKPKSEELELLGAEISRLRMDLNKLVNSILHYLAVKLKTSNTSRKLESWHELEFGDFIKELKKAIKASNKERAKEATASGLTSSVIQMPQLTKKDEFEWMELFEENKKKALELQREIEKTDAEIDGMVYELYGLTEKEIAIVEGSIK